VPTSTSVAVQLIHGAAKTNMMFELTMHVSGLPPTSKPSKSPNWQLHAATQRYDHSTAFKGKKCFMFQFPKAEASAARHGFACGHVPTASYPDASKPGYYVVILVDVSLPDPHNAT
jgi:hypothetical protein